ncbi:MAG TPA: YkgJ family cysteine cluster protein [Dehalococcoidia bacterium]|nr:YkgJ family cysteine cluster protein [Dehalococcoidia bacterium]
MSSLNPEEQFFADHVRSLYRDDEPSRQASLVEWQAAAELGQREAVACRSGCGACCHHLVPVWEVEALALYAAAQELPPETRSQVRANLGRWLPAYEAWLEEADCAGLEFDPATARQPFSAVATHYWQRRIPCPFLIDESCSIYADRPAECRYYYALRSPDACAQPDRLPVVQPAPLQRAGDRLRLQLIEAQRARDDGLLQPQVPLWSYAPALRQALGDEATGV